MSTRYRAQRHEARLDAQDDSWKSQHSNPQGVGHVIAWYVQVLAQKELARINFLQAIACVRAC